MGHILALLHNIVGFKVLAILLTVAMGAMVFQLSGPFKAYALNVHTEIKADPPGIAQIIDRSGQPPSGIVNPQGNAPTAFTTDSNGNLSGNTQQGDATPQGGGGSTPQGGTGSTPQGGNKALPPGIDKIVGRTGAPPAGMVNPQSNRPTALIINTDIDFDMTFPGEPRQGEFTIYLADTSTSPDGFSGSYTRVEYHLIFSTPSGYLDMTPYWTVERDPAETGEPSDTIASASLEDPDDTSDRWLVTFTAPNEPISVDYGTTITVEVTSTTP